MGLYMILYVDWKPGRRSGTIKGAKPGGSGHSGISGQVKALIPDTASIPNP